MANIAIAFLRPSVRLVRFAARQLRRDALSGTESRAWTVGGVVLVDMFPAPEYATRRFIGEYLPTILHVHDDQGRTTGPQTIEDTGFGRGRRSRDWGCLRESV